MAAPRRMLGVPLHGLRVLLVNTALELLLLNND